MSGPVPRGPPLAEPTLQPHEFVRLQRLLLRLAGIRLEQRRGGSISHRVWARVQASACSRFGEYLDAVEHLDPRHPELVGLVNALTVNHTKFFREEHHFEHLRSLLVARFRGGDPGGRVVRIWCAASSTGEEPYSIAMCAHDALAGARLTVQILASDIDTDVLAVAQRGIYGEERAQEVPEPYRSRYLRRGAGARGGSWRVAEEARRLVEFRRLNLVAPSWPVQGSFDAIFCRNALIYFDDARKRAVLDRFSSHLDPQGTLFLGHSESVTGLSDRYRLVGTTAYELKAAPPSPRASVPGAPVDVPLLTARPSLPSSVRPGALPGRRTRVLIVDDSAMMRELLTGLLAEDPQIEVVGSAADPFVAWEMIKRLRPHVLTLDVEMPRMDGLTFLELLMTHFPLPVVMVSSLTEAGCATAVRALELGAVEAVAKPKLDVALGMAEIADRLAEQVRAAGMARVRSIRAKRPAKVTPASSHRSLGGGFVRGTHGVICVGASTGGTEALTTLLTALPPDSPGLVIVQHMPENFTRHFADRMDGLCKVRVKEAADGDRVLPGHVLLAPGNHHMRVRRSGANYLVRVDQEPHVNRHRPSVDVLFDSCAEHLGQNAVGVILTGMGNDGAAGLRRMRDAGAHTIAQDEASCVVFGMPKEAIAAGGAVQVLPLDDIAGAVLQRTMA